MWAAGPAGRGRTPGRYGQRRDEGAGLQQASGPVLRPRFEGQAPGPGLRVGCGPQAVPPPAKWVTSSDPQPGHRATALPDLHSRAKDLRFWAESELGPGGSHPGCAPTPKNLPLLISKWSSGVWGAVCECVRPERQLLPVIYGFQIETLQWKTFKFI